MMTISGLCCLVGNSARLLSASSILWIFPIFLLQAQSLHSFSASPKLWPVSRTKLHAPTKTSGYHLSIPYRKHHRQQQQHHWPRLYNAATYSLEPDLEYPEFQRLSRIHSVVEKLKAQIPTLLLTPLTETSSRAVYAEDVKLVVDDIELASSREELESLSTTLVLAVLATNQAASFFANMNAVTGAGARPASARSASSSSPSSSQLESSMAMDPTSTAVRVEWKVKLLRQQQTNQQQQLLQGASELELDPLTGKVTTLRLLWVQFNQERLNARAIAESLSSLRQLVFAFQNSPFLPKSSGLPSLSSLLGSDVVQQLSLQSSSFVNDDDQPTKATPLFITESLETAFAGYNSTNDMMTTSLIPIDEYCTTSSFAGKNESSLQPLRPLPGSQLWNQYVAARRVYDTFCQDTLRILSGNLSVASTEMLQLFSAQAILKATDGSELLKGRDPVGNFFHTLASFRKRSSGTWELIHANLLNYTTIASASDPAQRQQVSIAVDYRATSSIPGSSAPVVIEGMDVFVLESPILSNANKMEESNNDDDDDDDEDVEILIKQIEQRKLNIKGAAITGGRPPDTLWFMKSLVALDSGRLSNVGADSVVMELLQRVIAGENGRGSSAGVNGDNNNRKRKRRRTPPKLSNEVAARVYSIMAGLHEDVPLLFDKDMLRTYQLPPLHEYMTKDVELRGYLGETLARGLPSYNNAVGTTFASLKGAIVTGGAKLDQEPAITVELTVEGNIRLGLSVDLKVLPLPSGAGELINSMSGNAISLPSGGFPLKFAIVSDYMIDKDTGEIYQHRIVETRINGQLTPGDVMSRWIQKQVAQSGAVSTNTNDGAVVQRGLMDAISWVRSVSGRG